MEKKDALLQINNVISNILQNSGFKVNKALDKYTRRKKPFVDVIEIFIGAKWPILTHHYRLSFSNTRVLELFEEIKARCSNTSDSLHSSGFVAFIEDWKNIPLKDIDTSTRNWFATFDNLNDIEGWEAHYKNVARASVLWFDNCHNMEKLADILFNMPPSNESICMYLCCQWLLDSIHFERNVDEIIQFHDNKSGWEKPVIELFAANIMSSKTIKKQ